MSGRVALGATAQASAAADVFAERFGARPRFAAFAPGRVNLIGEHTDYNDGFVLPVAIDRQMVIVATPIDEGLSTLHSVELDRTLVADLTEVAQPQPECPLNCLLGVAAEFRAFELTPRNMNAVISSTIPIGAGLSSSAALEVAFATLLASMLGRRLEPLEIAQLCQRAEHRFAGTPCGIMDMYVSAGAKAGHAMFIDCRTNHVQHVPMPPPDRAALLVIDSGVHRSLAAELYADRRQECETAAAAFGVRTLREASAGMIARASLEPTLKRRALHVALENSRTVLAAEALARNDLPRVGGFMFASHDSLRELFDVSCDELDAIVAVARSLSGEGVLGARMTGAGFGGCAIALCEPRAVGAVEQRIADAFHARFGRTPAMFTTGACGGAGVFDAPGQ